MVNLRATFIQDVENTPYHHHDVTQTQTYHIHNHSLTILFAIGLIIGFLLSSGTLKLIFGMILIGNIFAYINYKE